MARIDTRKGDRHTTPRKGDRHTTPRKGDRHKAGYKKPYIAKASTPWEGSFAAVDGEGWDGKYTLLACSAMTYDLYDPDGLSTHDCLEYLTDQAIPAKNALVGFGLSYDFENILKDLPEEDFIKLAKDGEKIQYQEFTLKYIPRKFLEIQRDTGDLDKKGKPIKKTTFLQDVWGFFQSNFENALKKWDVETPEIITKGKALREDFNKQPLDFIKAYNREELRLLIEVMEKLKTAVVEAFTEIDLRPNLTPRTWYGPGALASNFLRQTNWVKEHPAFIGPAADDLQNAVCGYLSPPFYNDAGEQKSGHTEQEFEDLRQNPFAAAFYGGRIEAAAVGTFKEKLWDYDINSAYPFALSHLPAWRESDLVKVSGLDPLNRMGMYEVDWDLPEGISFYPFPFRSRSGNVFFPRSGKGWYMSPEVLAALSIYGPDQVRVLQGYVLADTDGSADGIQHLPEEKLCLSARKMLTIAAVRLKAKREKRSSEKALKLVMNSCYGKTIQQVGSHKFLNTFAAAWITSTCRAIISKAIGADKDNSVISIMTDGILTRKPLPVKLGRELGEFEETNFNYCLQFMPGVYYLENTETGEKVSRYRGMDKSFDPKKAVKILHNRYQEIREGKKVVKRLGVQEVNLRIFVTRSLAIHQPNKFGELIYQFVPIIKEEEFSLKSKRAPGAKGFRLKLKEKHKFFEAKDTNPIEQLLFGGSMPYILNLPAELAYDMVEDEMEMLSGNRINSIIEGMKQE